MPNSNDIDLQTGGQIGSSIILPNLGHDLFWGIGIGFVVGLLTNITYDYLKKRWKKKNRKPRFDLAVEEDGVYFEGYVNDSNYASVGAILDTNFSITKSPKRKNLKHPDDSKKNYIDDYVSDETKAS